MSVPVIVLNAARKHFYGPSMRLSCYRWAPQQLAINIPSAVGPSAHGLHLDGHGRDNLDVAAVLASLQARGRKSHEEAEVLQAAALAHHDQVDCPVAQVAIPEKAGNKRA